MLVSCISLGISVVVAGCGIRIGFVCSDLWGFEECGQSVSRVLWETTGAGAMGEVLKFVFWRWRGESGWPRPEEGIGGAGDGVIEDGRVESHDPVIDWGFR